MVNEIPKITLNDGLTIPVIGFGTSSDTGEVNEDIISSAIDVGYRLIDSAYSYGNVGIIGDLIRSSWIPREKFRVSSKLPGRCHSYDKAISTVKESLMKFGFDYFDLYLIHFPNPKQGLYVEAWQALIEAKKRGWVRSIGVCNFLPEHLDHIISETGITPSVNQVELHPYFSQEKIRALHKRHDIVTEAWSPIGRSSPLIQDATIRGIAEVHQKSIAQIILRWHIQLGILPLPKSSTKERQIENLSIFDFSLTNEEMQKINKMTRTDGRIEGINPAVYEEF